MRALLDVLKSFAVGVVVLLVVLGCLLAWMEAVIGRAPSGFPAWVLIASRGIGAIALVTLLVFLGNALRDIHRGRPR